ncbi:DUF397 domain-containing protein [Nocardia asteroides]|uniref:DUF397 domain-containing protein n=1 Tax=Nocardia asteroides TaxID=1824 RepID=UPI001E5DD58F|nr:DUF397 domain-containing protein [Nocardia asteroides]UGT59868.1 DUF397 domain-containing protein [Nocardia asteroides]
MSTGDRLQWRTSSYSGNGENCVEVAPGDTAIYVRHSKYREAGIIAFPHATWPSFLDDTRTGTTSHNAVVAVEKRGDDTVVESLRGDVQLRFDAGEWTAFRAGVVDGEFDATSLNPS